MAADPYKYFRIEARELVEQLGKATLALEQEGNGLECVQRLLRFAHTLKGAARVTKQAEIADASHAIEEKLAPYRQAGERVPPDLIEAVLKLVDGIGARVASLSAVPGGPAAAPRGSPEEAAPTVRADVAEVDALLEGLAETHVQLSAVRRALGPIERARNLGEVLAGQLSPRRSRDAQRSGTERALSTAEDLLSVVGGLERAVGSAIDQMERELRQVREAAEHLRLVPADSLLSWLERTVRDSAQALDKQVHFEGRGGSVRIDAHVLGAVQVALVQIARNAVAHGIETAAERRVAGKALAGRFGVEIVRQGRQVVVRCRDDGRGVDLEALRRAAAKRGLSLPSQLDGVELARALLRSGMSTSAAVTEVSGRGVGLDVVREVIERLGGEVRLQTERGRGTEFELIVPLSLASIDALTVESAGIVATLPLDAVKRALQLAQGDISRTAEGESLVFEGRVIPFVPLPRALGRTLPPAPAPARAGRAAAAVIVAVGDRLAALGVDRLLGTSTVVLRPLSDLTPADSVVAGASLDAEGNPQLVLEPEGILGAAARAAVLAPTAAAARHSVLVVDDSMTTRMLEQSILESAGYDVDVAASAEEGLEKARRRSHALFLVDVEMPGMDGFTFIERVRADPLLRGTPAILVTSRAAPEDRDRGELVGAQGYIVKSEFDQSGLLARIRRLVE